MWILFKKIKKLLPLFQVSTRHKVKTKWLSAIFTTFIWYVILRKLQPNFSQLMSDIFIIWLIKKNCNFIDLRYLSKESSCLPFVLQRYQTVAYITKKRDRTADGNFYLFFFIAFIYLNSILLLYSLVCCFLGLLHYFLEMNFYFKQPLLQFWYI